MKLSQKIGKFSGIIAIGLLLIFCLLISPGLTVFDAQNLSFLRAVSASSYQNNAHHPLYSSVRGRDNKRVRDHWEPLLEKFKVDLVLQGHDHVYSRGQGPGKADGPVYITSVSGPKMYNLARAEWMDRAGGNVQLFQVVSISPKVLNYRSVTATGEIYDAFELVKEDGQNSRLINRIPVEKAASTTR